MSLGFSKEGSKSSYCFIQLPKLTRTPHTTHPLGIMVVVVVMLMVVEVVVLLVLELKIL